MSTSEAGIQGHEALALKWLRFPMSQPCRPWLQEAVVDDSDAQYPVIIFSHGLGGCRSTYCVLCSELASQVIH